MSMFLDHQKPVPADSVLAISAAESVDALFFWCPGCEELHQVHIDPAHPNSVTGACWSWNGDYVKPTIKPSILVHGWKSPNPEFAKGQPRCHSFVVDGQIIYCSDSEHSLAGKTVPLPANPLEQ